MKTTAIRLLGTGVLTLTSLARFQDNKVLGNDYPLQEELAIEFFYAANSLLF